MFTFYFRENKNLVFFKTGFLIPFPALVTALADNFKNK